MMLKRKIRLKTGVTLIEILVYVTILVSLLALVTNFLYQVANFKLNNQIQSAVFQNSSLALNKITEDLKQTTVINNPVNDNFSNTLGLQTNNGQVDYTVINGFLLRNGEEITDNSVLVNISSNSRGFRKIGNSVQVIIGFIPVQKPFGHQQKEIVYQTSISLMP